MKTLAVAGATFKEAVSGKAYYIIVLYLLILVACDKVLIPLALGTGDKISKDIGFSAMSVLALFAAVMIGANVLRQTEDRKSLSFMMSKPLQRHEFVLGKYLGVNGTVLSALILMAIVLSGFLAFRAGRFEAGILKVVALNGLELVLITGLILFFASFAVPFVTVTSTLALYVAGHFRYDVRLFGEQTGSPVTEAVCRVVYYLIPNLGMFNARGRIVHGISVPWTEVGLAAGYAALYAGALIGLAILIFSRKDLS